MKKFFAVLLLVLAACGKRGDPHPPLPAIPKAASDLLVTQRGSKVILIWSYPSLTTAGRNLPHIRRVIVYRYREQLPAPQAGRDAAVAAPGNATTTQPPAKAMAPSGAITTQPAAIKVAPSGGATTQPSAIAAFARIAPMKSAQFNRLKERLDSIEGDKLPASSVGAKLEYEDSPPLRASDGRPIRLTYAVVTEGDAARSDLSNLVAIVPLDVPSPPSAVTAKARPEGVVLSWTAPDPAPENPGATGYNIYRAPSLRPNDELTTPVNKAPVAATTFTDVPAYGDFRYRVAAVVYPGPPRIESEPSTPASATFKDLMPPPPPTNVSALVETHAVRLVWDPVQASDLAGYRIYRTEGVGHTDIREVGTIPLMLQPLTVTAYVDPAPDLGIEFKYAVTSIDKSGNESGRVWTGWVVVPKTP